MPASTRLLPRSGAKDAFTDWTKKALNSGYWARTTPFSEALETAALKV